MILGGRIKLVKAEEVIDCDIEIVRRRIADAKGDMNGLAVGLRWVTFGSYASFRHKVDQLLLAVSSGLKNMSGREAMALQHGVCGAVLDIAGGIQRSFIGFGAAADSSLSRIVAALKCDESAKPGFFSAYSANCERRQRWTKAVSGSGGSPMSNTHQSAAQVSLGATDPLGYLGRW